MKLTQLFLCSAALALSLTLPVLAQKNDDRWFEVEVILFSQLGDKSLLTEHFPAQSKLPAYRRVEDLLAEYLNPDIRSLKQLLPSCDSPHYPENLVRQNAKLPALFTAKSLNEIAQAAELSDDNNASKQELAQFSDQSNSQAYNTDAITPSVVAPAKDTAEQAALNNGFDLNVMATDSELSLQAREETQRLVLAADNEFQTLKFHYTAKTEPKTLCRIDPRYFADMTADGADFDYYGFTVKNVPLQIDAVEEITNDQTHLLAKASLQLGDVITDLRYSKNFRPLLHMGWRQVARPKKQSVPVKVYAGDNFNADYQKQLKHFNNQREQQLAQLLQYSNEPQALTSTTEQTQALQLQQAQQTRIAEIIANLEHVDENVDTLLASLDSEDLALRPPATTLTSVASAQPMPPVQKWFIEGFFNIHLKHYLFITADFSILDKNLSELATANLNTIAPINSHPNTKINSPSTIQAKAIPFKQDRRVISGEVHYFDHPYMGMIVQIRPYSKPEPEENR